MRDQVSPCEGRVSGSLEKNLRCHITVLLRNTGKLVTCKDRKQLEAVAAVPDKQANKQHNHQHNHQQNH
jgi:hypothetical protein